MKKTIFCLIAFVLMLSCSKQDSFKITADFEALDSSMAYLFIMNEEGRYTARDSVEFQNGKFGFSGSVHSPVTGYIRLNGRNTGEFFLENTKIMIAGHADSLQKIKVAGPVNQQFLDKTEKKLEPVQQELRDILAQYRSAQSAGDQKTMDRLVLDYQNKQEQINDLLKAEAEDHAETAAGAFLVYRRLRHSLSLDEKKEFASSFKGEGASSLFAQLLSDEIRVLESVEIGRAAPDFEMENPDGEMIRLSSFRGKPLLINFWASWCGPCRAKNPRVVELYERLGNHHFEILGVSLDRSREDWLKGIRDDYLSWPQVSDLKFWDNSAAKLYGVRGIPHSVLLDAEGIIIGRNLSEDEIFQKVAALGK